MKNNDTAIDPEWLMNLITCLLDNWKLAVIIFLVMSILIYKQKCDKNIIELFVDAIKMSDRKGIAGLLLLFVFLIISNFENDFLKGIGLVGGLVVLGIFIRQKDPVDDIGDALDNSNRRNTNNTRRSVLGEQE